MVKTPDNYTKQDWLAANTHGDITEETIIHRVFRTDHLLNDIRNGTLTLVNPCFETQGDDLENPLKNANFHFEGHKHKLLQGLMTEYYTQSWSLVPAPWGVFGGGHDTVRVSCNAMRLFDRVMDEKDPFYSLYYHIGLVTYEQPSSIAAEVRSADFSDYLDSQGYGLLRTILRIRTDFRKEREVRVVYIRSPRGENQYPLRHDVFGPQKEFCAHKFDWRGLIEAFEFNPDNQSKDEQLATALHDLTAIR